MVVRPMRVFAVVLIAAALMLAGATSALAAPKPKPGAVSFDFDGPDPRLTLSGYAPSTGLYSNSLFSASYDPALGVMSLTPNESRGACYVQTKDAVVTKLPATVTARVKYPTSYWRHPSFLLSPAEYIDPVTGGYVEPSTPVGTIGFTPGNLGWVYYPYVGGAAITQADGTQVIQYFDPAPVLSADTWIDVVINLYPDHAVFTAEGRSMTLVGDVKSIVEQPGGLRLNYECDDDYQQLGTQIDYIRVQ